MVKEVPFLQDDADRRIVANEGGFGLLAEMRQMNARLGKLECHRQSHLDVRQRAISIWVRDALKKETGGRRQAIRRLNKDVIHGGDVRSDKMVVTERYKKSSTEWQSFRTLYGLTPDNMIDINQQKCCESLQALNRAASILLKHARTSLPTEAMVKRRAELVALLLDHRYEEAEMMSSTFLCVPVAEE